MISPWLFILRMIFTHLWKMIYEYTKNDIDISRQTSFNRFQRTGAFTISSKRWFEKKKNERSPQRNLRREDAREDQLFDSFYFLETLFERTREKGRERERERERKEKTVIVAYMHATPEKILLLLYYIILLLLLLLYINVEEKYILSRFIEKLVYHDAYVCTCTRYG